MRVYRFVAYLLATGACPVQSQQLHIFTHLEGIEPSETFEKVAPIEVPYGATLTLPGHLVVRAVEVRFPSHLADGNGAAPHLQLSDRHLSPARFCRSSKDKVLCSISTDPRGLFAGAKERLEVVRAARRLDGPLSWEIRRKEQPFIEIWKSNSGEPPPDVRIDSPALKFITGGTNSVQIEGAVETTDDVTVSIGGTKVSRDVNRDGWGFSVTVPLERDASHVEVAVDDGKGSQRKILLLVVR